MQNQKASKILPPIVVDSIIDDLAKFVRKAVGLENVCNINPTIPLVELGRRCFQGMGIFCPILLAANDWETLNSASKRLIDSGHILANIAGLALVTEKYPAEIREYSAVFALDECSRWTNSDGNLCVPYSTVKDKEKNKKRGFGSCRLDHLIGHGERILVFRRVAPLTDFADRCYGY